MLVVEAVFDAERRRVGDGSYVTVTLPDSEPRRVTETFKTDGEALALDEKRASGVAARAPKARGCQPRRPV